jgi:hypothetical protein
VDAAIAKLSVNRLTVVPFMHPVTHRALAVATALCRRGGSDSDVETVRHIQARPPDRASIDQCPSYGVIVDYNTIPHASFFFFFLCARLVGGSGNLKRRNYEKALELLEYGIGSL